MDKLHSIIYPIVVHSLEVNKDLFHPKKDNEELLGLKVPDYNVIKVLMYLRKLYKTGYCLFVNLLARYSYALTQRH